MKIDKSKKKSAPPLKKKTVKTRSKKSKESQYVLREAEKKRRKHKEQREERIEEQLPSAEIQPPDPPWKEPFDEALVYYQQGVGGNAEAVGKAIERLERVRELAPDNNLAKAYYGGAVVLTGRDAVQSTDKFRNVMKGLQIIDECVEAEPENVEIRLLRGFVNQRLPELYFHRTAKAADDFAFVVEAYEKDNSVVPQDLYWRALYEWGAACKKLENYAAAQKAWRKLLALTTDDRYSELLKRESRVMNGTYREEDPEAKEQEKKRWERGIPPEGIELYGQALGGDREAAHKAYELFSEIYEKNKRNPLVRAYYADCLSMMGKYQTQVPDMIGYTIKAMKLYDGIVSEYPDNIRLRLMHAYHSYRLPETFFHRTVTAIEGFQYLLGRYEADPTVLPEDVYWQIQYDLGSAHYRLGMTEEARVVWAKLTASCPDPQYREKIEMLPMPDDPVPDFSEYGREQLYEEGKRLHAMGVAGNRRAAIMARECWRTAYEQFPGDTLAQAYYGSSIALSARDGVEPEQIFRTTYQGLNLLNEAVEYSPEDTEIRMLRAYVLNALPRPFFPSHQAVHDFRALLEAHQHNPGLFSAQRHDKLTADMQKAAEKDENPLAGLEERLSPVIRNLLAERVIRP